jgi:hypothetical protein
LLFCKTAGARAGAGRHPVLPRADPAHRDQHRRCRRLRGLCAALDRALRRLGWGPGRVSETINEQVSHVGFCRKAEQLQKLGASEMVRIKSIIDKEVGKFERTLKREYQPYWKPRQFVPLRLELLSKNVSSATSQSGSWKNYK